MQQALSLLVFTDLDGTLIDHDGYGWHAAKPALAALSKLEAGVVMASSKTAPEIIALQTELGLRQWPAIVENGAGLLEPNQESSEQPARYVELRAALETLPKKLRNHFVGFADMSVQKVAEVTGLPPHAATLAKTRGFSEPGLWHGSTDELSDFLQKLTELGISAREGGRFLTLSFGKTKADRMAEITSRYNPRYTVALGDAPNDVEMLQTADFGVIVANPHREALPPQLGEAEGRIVRTELAGPEGWNLAIIKLITRLELHKGTQ